LGYLVFARKWRPQTFDQVLAQDHVTVTLKNAIRSGRVGHSYLFTGPRGVGKTTTARILAKALNCREGPTPDPCGECDACVGITRGNHLDVMEIDGASNRGIDEIRELRQKVRYASSSGRYKIYIIDEVHMLTNEAFNALLKILEEPPERVVFVFATTAPRKVPATILSRCQRFDFRRIPSAVMADYISGEASKEGIEIDRRALLMVCRAGGGSMRDALSIMDQLVSYAGGPIDAGVVSELLGLVGADLLEAIVSAMLRGDSAGALESVAGAMSRGHDSVELLESLVSYLRNLMLVTAGAPAGLEGVSDAEAEAFRRLSDLTDELVVLNLIRILGAAAREARRDSLPRVALETAVMAATKLAQAVRVESLPPSGGAASGPAAQAGEAGETDAGGDRAQKEAKESPAPEDETAGETDEERETREREEERNRQVFGLFDAIPRNGG
jgi:DNA polymerase-3 subunit gamma/tau